MEPTFDNALDEELLILSEQILGDRSVLEAKGDEAQRKLDLLQLHLTIENVAIDQNGALGSGQLGDVWKARIGRVGKKQIVCAVKIAKKSWSDGHAPHENLDSFLREGTLLRQLVHPNVLPFLGMFRLNDGQGNVCLVSPYMSNGNLAQYMEKTRPGKADILSLMHDIALGLEYLHREDVVHGNLKVHNVLISDANRACLSDYSIPHLEPEVQYSLPAIRWGSKLGHTAPEVLLGSPSSKKSDVYSYGSLCHEIFGKAYEGREASPRTWAALRAASLSDNRQSWHLLRDCCALEPSARPTAGEVVRQVIAKLNLEPGGASSAQNWDESLYSTILENIDTRPLLASMVKSEPASQGSIAVVSSSQLPGDRQADDGLAPNGVRAAAADDSSLELVRPLQATENRWDRQVLSTMTPESPEMIARKVRALLNKITIKTFDSISDQVIAWVNKSEQEEDGSTLIMVIGLVFEKAINEAMFSETYARLCRKMMEQISPRVQDVGVTNAEGKPIAGRQLFRKYLLNRCQEDFECSWTSQTPSNDDEKVRRRSLGLPKFIGELFKVQMLTERIMRECIKKLLGNLENPEEAEMGSLCELLVTVGGTLDTPKARAHMDVYFSRMKELTKHPNIQRRVQFTLLDVIELRERKWAARKANAKPTTINQIRHELAAAKAAQAYVRHDRARDPSFYARWMSGRPVPPEEKVVEGGGATRVPSKAGRLSKFGQISSHGAPIASSTGSASNWTVANRASLPTEVEMHTNNAKLDSAPLLHKKLILHPRLTLPGDATYISKAKASREPKARMSLADARRRAEQDSEEFFAIRDLDEAEFYFSRLPPQHHHLLVDKLISHAVESEEADAQLVSDLLERASSKSLASSAALEEAFSFFAELLVDIVYNAPDAPKYFALMMRGAGFKDRQWMRIASKSEGQREKLFEFRPGKYSDDMSSEEREAEVSQADAMKIVEANTKEFFVVRDFDEGKTYFDRLPPQHHYRLVDKLVSCALYSTEEDAQLVSDLLQRVSSESLASSADLVEAFSSVAEFLDELTFDVPGAPELFALMMSGAAFSDEEWAEVVSKSEAQGAQVLKWKSVMRRKLIHRSHLNHVNDIAPGPVLESDSEGTSGEQAEMSEAKARKKIEEDLKEFFASRNLDRAELYFQDLPSQHHGRLVDSLVFFALESKKSDAQLVSDLLRRVSWKSLASSAALEEAFSSLSGLLDAIVEDTPEALNLFALMMRGASFSDDKRRWIAFESEYHGEKIFELSSERLAVAEGGILSRARAIDNLELVPYPEGVRSPQVELNVNAVNGRFRYDRDFLLQFMSVCKDKPTTLPPLDTLGLEPRDPVANSAFGVRSGIHGIHSAGTGLNRLSFSSLSPIPAVQIPFGGRNPRSQQPLRASATPFVPRFTKVKHTKPQISTSTDTT
ncbi:hypothetical protein V5O48_016868 [Marasmius crinis-equi]|uniref:Uncharacterized protein n=1 Tax=Marasmius crinis-equi TaxID=585013 RepID=A0ABR3EQS9_9AGAR